MQVFIIGSPLETAKALDKRRLYKQIVECGQILRAISPTNIRSCYWSNHPCVVQYRNHKEWLEHYQQTLANYRLIKIGQEWNPKFVLEHNKRAEELRPNFHTEEFFNQMKRRLYTKDNEYYAKWSEFGESQENWYWSEDDGKFLKYVNGKLVE